MTTRRTTTRRPIKRGCPAAGSRGRPRPCGQADGSLGRPACRLAGPGWLRPPARRSSPERAWRPRGRAHRPARRRGDAPGGRGSNSAASATTFHRARPPRSDCPSRPLWHRPEDTAVVRHRRAARARVRPRTDVGGPLLSAAGRGSRAARAPRATRPRAGARPGRRRSRPRRCRRRGRAATGRG
jgi:hypothetical protein